MQREIIEKAYIIEPLSATENEEEKLLEITELAKSAGAEVLGFTSQVIREVVPATYIGSGKLAEIKEKTYGENVDIFIFDGELTPSQTLNMSEALGGIKVVDRTTLILDIFALHAKSSEGKLQIELAQLKYIYPRLKGKGQALSRLGGGIGTRGPGETKLETDRRHIRARIKTLEEKLEELKTRRDLQQYRREKNSCCTVALVGYTNTGKSTLLNALTGADAYVENQLFATLDPTVRKLKLSDMEILLVDTVGFVRNIPHHIIEAFRSTLEFAVRADLILIVCDGSSENYFEQYETTVSTLAGFSDLPETLTVINKCDKFTDRSGYPQDAVFISAKENIGLEKLKDAILKKLSCEFTILNLKIPYSSLSEFNKLIGFAESSRSEYTDDGANFRLSVRNKNMPKFKKYIN